MTVEVEGGVGSGGMVLDFQEIKRAVRPLVDAWDHATLVSEHDDELLDIARQAGWKHFVFPDDTTSEHLAQFVADYLFQKREELLRRAGITRVRVRLAETETCYAEAERAVEKFGGASDTVETARVEAEATREAAL